MGLWFCFPKLQRCCCCTRKLRAACVLICIFIMFTGAHAFAMFMSPACSDMFDEDNEGDLLEPLVLVMWCFLPCSLLLLVSNFLFFLAIFKVPRQCLRYVARDFLVFCGLVWAGLAIALANLQLLHMVNCDCNNHSDIIACFIYTPCMIYYMIIVNSYKDLKGKNDTVLDKAKKQPKKPKKEPTTKLGKCWKVTLELIGRVFFCKRKNANKPKASKTPKVSKTPKTLKPPKEPKKLKSPKEPRPPKVPKPPKSPKEKKDKKNKERTEVTPDVAITPGTQPAAATDTTSITPTGATEVANEVSAKLPPDTAEPLKVTSAETTVVSPSETAPPESPAGITPPTTTPEKAPTISTPPASTPGEVSPASPPVTAPLPAPPVNPPSTTPPATEP